MPPPDDKEEEVMSEVTERSMEANMKILVGNEIAHSNRVAVLAETSLADAVNLSRKTNDAYLEMSKQQANAFMEQSKKQSDAYMEHANAQNKEAVGFVQELHKQYLENNRYTLDRLYSVFPEEAMGIASMVTLIIESLKQSGWTPPTKA